MDLKSRIEKLQLRQSSLKHLRGKHDQLDHAWNRGMGQGGYGAGLAPNQMGPLPTQDFYRQRLTDLTNQRRRGEITRAEMRRQMRDLRGIVAVPEVAETPTLANKPKRNGKLQSLVLGNRSGKPRLTISGDDLYQEMNDQSVKPSRQMLSRFLLEYGHTMMKQQYRMLEEKEKDPVTGKSGVSSIAKVRIPTLPFWAQGENFFSSMPKTSSLLNENQIQNKSGRWLSAYTYAVGRQKTQYGDNFSANESTILKNAQDFADHIDYMTGDESPYTDASNLIAIDMLSSISTRLSDAARNTANQFDVSVGLFQRLRRLFSTSSRLIQKYGFQLDPNQVSEDFDTVFDTSDMKYVEDGVEQSVNVRDRTKGIAILEAMKKRDKKSVFGYVADKFPENQTYLADLWIQGLRGGNDVPGNPALYANFVESIKKGQEANAEMFSRPSMLNKNGMEVPYAAETATLPEQVDTENGKWAIDSNGTIKELSSIQLAQAIDPGGNNALMAAAGGRISINSSVAQKKLDLIQSLSAQTGLSPDVVAQVLAMWQYGSQTIDAKPIPTLAFLQKAAAELFDLTLGYDGPLDKYQYEQIVIATDVLSGSAQPDAYATKFNMAAEERNNPEVMHFYRDAFNPYANLDTPKIFDEDFLTMFREKKSSSKELNDYEEMSDEEKQKIPADKRQKIEEQIKERDEFNSRMRLSTASVLPGMPYENADQARKALLKSIYNDTQKLLQDAGIKNATLYRTISLSQQQLEDLQDQYRERTGDKTFSIFDDAGDFDPDKVVGAMFDIPRNAMESWSTDHITASALGANVEEILNFSQEEVDSGNGGKKIKRYRSTAEPVVAEIVVGGNFDASRIVSTPRTGFGQYREGEVIVTGSKADRLRVISAHKRANKVLERLAVTKRSKFDELFTKINDRSLISKSAYFYNDATQNAIVNGLRIAIARAKATARMYEKNVRIEDMYSDD